MQIISEYTREQAVSDGVLIPVKESVMLKAGFRGKMYAAQEFNSKVKSFANLCLREAERKGKKDTFECWYQAAISAALFAANIAVHEAAKSPNPTNITSFEWYIHTPGSFASEKVISMISVEKTEKEGVVWTLMNPSDY